MLLMLTNDNQKRDLKGASMVWQKEWLRIGSSFDVGVDSEYDCGCRGIIHLPAAHLDKSEGDRAASRA